MAYLPHQQGKRIFIKDITHYLVPPNGAPPSIAPSLGRKKRGVGTSSTTNGTTNGVDTGSSVTNGATNPSTGPPYPYHTDPEPDNPTVIPLETLKRFHFTFLIRRPQSAIPSYYRCTVPPLREVTGFHHFMPAEAGYDELRRVFDYLRSVNLIGPKVCGQNSSTETNGAEPAEPDGTGDDGQRVEICVVDADDLLDDPESIVQTYCASVGLDYNPDMLNWDTEEDHERARKAFEKWKGFHEDAINSTDLKPRKHVS